MKRTTLDGVEYVVSRIRRGKLELVEVQTGKLVVKDETPIETYLHENPVTPNLVTWPNRGIRFLSELHERRKQFLEESRKSKRKAPSLDKAPRSRTKDPNAPKAPRKPRTAKVDKKVEEILLRTDLPPEILAELMAMRKK